MTVVAVSEDGTNVDVRWLNEDGDARRWTFPCAALTLVEFSRLSDLTRSPPASMGGGYAMTDEPRCGSCRFHVQQSCRRHPPSMTGHLGGIAAFPGVQEDTWCGEYERHPAPPPPQGDPTREIFSYPSSGGGWLP